MLSAGALRMYAWICLRWDHFDTTNLVSQIRNKHDRYAALRELEAAGIILVHRERGKASSFQLRFHSVSSVSIYSGSVLEDTSIGTPTPPSIGTPTPVEDTSNGYLPIPVEDTLYGYDSLEDEADDIDTMPDEGRDNPAKANTPFRTRRKQQRGFVQRAWGEIYPNLPPLIDANASELLKLSDESAAILLSIFRQFQGNSKACFAYLRGVARNQQAKRAQSVATTSPASSSQFEGWDSDEAYYAYQKKSQELAREYGYGDE